MKKKLPIIIAALVLVATIVALVLNSNKNTFYCTIELGEEYVFDATKIFGVTEEEASEFQADLFLLDTTKAGQYEVTVTRGNEEYKVIYTVEDTKDPSVTLNKKVVFTNNIDTTDFSKLATVWDGSAVTQSLCKFKKLDDLKVLDDAALKSYTDTIVDTNDTEGLLKRTDDLANGDGIYSAVYLVEDAFGHKTAKEVIVVYDTQNPVVSGVEEMNVEVEVDDPSAEWTNTYIENISFSDNVDGQITKDMLSVSMDLTDEENHVYTVKAEYTDRAGNKTSVEYTITLVEDGGSSEADDSDADKDDGDSDDDKKQEDDDDNKDDEDDKKDEDDKDDKDDEDEGYSYEDRDGDGFADLGETTVMNGFVVKTFQITPKSAKEKLAVANAGYNNIICVNGNYWVLVKAGQYQKGVEMLDEYLSERNLGWISMDNSYFDINHVAEYVRVFARDVYELE